MSQAMLVDRWYSGLLHKRRIDAGIDCHVEIERRYSSVPFRLVHEAVEARMRSATIEVSHNGRRVATHARSFVA